MTNELEPVANLVRKHWRSQGLAIARFGVAALGELTLALPQLPEPYVTFLRLAGLPTDADPIGMRFWHPHELRAIGEPPSVIIADYLRESWWYVLWLSGSERGRVSLLLDRNDIPRPPIGTLANFLRAYVVDDASLYPREQRSCAREILACGLDDWVDLPAAMWIVKTSLRLTADAEIRDATLDVLSGLLRDELMSPGDVTESGFRAWDMEPGDAIARIANEWRALERPPGMGDICWLANRTRLDDDTT